MKNIKSFILGMTTVVVLLPIAESVTELICSYLEPPKVENTKKVLKGNKEIADLQIELEGYHDDGNCIGFQVDDPIEEDEDDWEEDDKTVIGFK